MKALRILAPLLLLVASGCGEQFRISATNACIGYLKDLDTAKLQWSLTEHKSTNDTPTMADIARYMYRGAVPTCPSGGVYTLGRVCDEPKCSIKGHKVPGSNHAE